KSLYSCQKGDEKLGATDTLRCIYIDTPVADWTAAQNSLSSSVQDACTGAAYPNLDLCIAGPSSQINYCTRNATNHAAINLARDTLGWKDDSSPPSVHGC